MIKKHRISLKNSTTAGIFFYILLFSLNNTYSYEIVAGQDWKSWSSTEELRDAGLFWWFNTSEDPNNYVDLVDDPTFGKACRITFAPSPGITPTGAPRYLNKLNPPLAKMWFRFRVKFSPGWTTVGPEPKGHANSYKLVFWLWQNYEGRGQIEFSNTDDYILGFGVNKASNYFRYNETQLPGSMDFGEVTTEWTDGEWYEFVIYYEKTGDESARQHWWRRRITEKGEFVDLPFVYAGIEVSGYLTPLVRAVELGANKNKITTNTMHIYWGPWEVVDGEHYSDPFRMFTSGCCNWMKHPF